MRFDTVIRNGTVVTATDTYTSDVGMVDGQIAAIGRDLPRENADKVIDAAECYVMPGGIDVHTHLDMPFGGTRSADDFESGTVAAAHGGTTTLIDFAIQYKGQTLHQAFDTWMKKADGKAVIDYAFHCIITELPDTQLQEMKTLVREGVPTFKLFMAYPGVFMLDDASSDVRGCRLRRHDLHARGKRRRNRRNRAARAGRRKTGAEVSCSDASDDCRGGSDVARYRAR